MQANKHTLAHMHAHMHAHTHAHTYPVHTKFISLVDEKVYLLL